MAQGYYGAFPSQEFDVQYPYAITSVVYDPRDLNINGDPCPNATVRVSMTCLRDGTRINVPITQTCLSLLPSPQQRAFEAQAAKDAQEIKALKTSLLAAKLSAADWEYRSNQHLKEVKRLETVCGTHHQGKQDAEQKWVETVGELDNARQQLKEVRASNGKLLGNNICQASKIQALESQLNLLKHQYEGKCQEARDLMARIRQLETTGSAKERDEYSKALNHKDIQISQITKEAREWKEKAHLFADQRDAAELRLAAHKTLYATPPAVADKSLNTRLADVEARVEKLEEAEGFPMGDCPDTDFHANKRVMLYMGGQWVEGGRNYTIQGPSKGSYSSVYSPTRNMQWDKANQPTRWKPLPK